MTTETRIPFTEGEKLLRHRMQHAHMEALEAMRADGWIVDISPRRAKERYYGDSDYVARVRLISWPEEDAFEVYMPSIIVPHKGFLTPRFITLETATVMMKWGWASHLSKSMHLRSTKGAIPVKRIKDVLTARAEEYYRGLTQSRANANRDKKNEAALKALLADIGVLPEGVTIASEYSGFRIRLDRVVTHEQAQRIVHALRGVL